MADMYDRELAESMLKRLKEKLSQESPESLETLDDMTDAQGDETEEDDFSLSFDDEDKDEDVFDIIDAEEDEADTADEDMPFEGTPISMFDEDGDEQNEYREPEPDTLALDDEEDDGTPPWDVEPEPEPLPEPPKKKRKSKQELVLDAMPEPEDDEINDDTSEVAEPASCADEVEDFAEEMAQIEDVQDEISEDFSEPPTIEDKDESEVADLPSYEQDEEDMAATLLTRKKKKSKIIPEELTETEELDEEECPYAHELAHRDVLKRPLPKGWKVARAFFAPKKQEEIKILHESDQDVSETSLGITVWRALLFYSRWSFALTILSALCLLLVGCFESIPAISKAVFSGIPSEDVVMYTMLVDAGIVFLALMFYLPAIIGSFKRLSCGIVDTEFFAFLAGILTFLYLTIGAFFSQTAFLPAMPAVLILTVSQLMRLLSCVSAMNHADICLNSRNGTTAVLHRASDMPEVTTAFGEEKEYHAILSTGKFDHSDAFLERLNYVYIQSRVNLACSLVAVLLGGLFSGAFAVFGVAHPVGCGLIVMCAAFPLSAFTFHSWDAFRLGQELRESKMTAAGETAIHELADADAVCFTDAHAFPASQSKIVRVKLCEEKRVDKLFLQLRALFAVLGGPLNGLFSVSGDIDDHFSVHIEEVTDDGIRAMIGEEVVLLGKGSYMSQNNVPFLYDAEDENFSRAPAMQIMYVSIEGKGSAKLYLEYKLSETFEAYVHFLRKQGVGVVLRTRDPNVTSSMISNLAYTEEGVIGVVRSRVGMKTPAESLSGALVAYGVSPARIYMTKFLFSAYRKMQKCLPWLSALTIPLCTILCGMSAMAESSALSWLTILCQLLMAVPSLITVEAILRKYQMGEEENDQ
ncbi:MAG: hypothetical protein J6R42_00535 [Clostridia bacterium]|nr:hypothetical protein [Clostridia bacterium]